MKNRCKHLILLLSLVLMSSTFTSCSGIKSGLKTPNKSQNSQSIRNETLKGYSSQLVNKAKVPNKHPSAKGIPVLTYHCIDNNIFGEKYLFVSPSVFDKQMEYLKESGFTPITFRDIEQPTELNKIAKPIIITFDDGYEDNYTDAYPILKKYHYKATIFLISDFIGKGHYLSIPEIKSMMDLVDFEDHTKSHPHLTSLTPGDVDKEFKESIDAIQNITSLKVIAASYPFGIYNQDVVGIAKKYFKYAVTEDYGLFDIKSGKNLQIRRMNVVESMGMDQFRRMLQNAD